MKNENIFSNLEKYKDFKSIIYYQNNRYNNIDYNTLVKKSSKINIRIEKNKLVILLCDNSIENIIYYVGLIRNNNKIILADSNSNNDHINILIKNYKPSYILGKNNIVNNYSKYKIKKLNKNFSFINFTQNYKIKINKDIAVLISTSGTTGSPKLVKLTYNNLLDNAKNIIKYLKLSLSNKTILTLPIHYSFGLSIINTYLFSGAQIIVNNYSINEKKFWQLCNKTNPNSLSFVPYQLELIKKLKLYKFINSNLRYITQAGGKLEYDEMNFFLNYSKENFIKFIVMYGQTEASPRMSYLPWKNAFNKLGSIGKAIPGGKFEIWDKNDKKINSINTEGELVYFGKNVSIGISESFQDLNKKDENKGILKTGDVAIIDKDGFYFIKGRLNRYAKIYGLRINLDELQDLLNKKFKQIICIELKNKIAIFHLKDKNINNLINEVVNITKLNKNSFVLKKIDSIPRNSSGKILYKKLL